MDDKESSLLVERQSQKSADKIIKDFKPTGGIDFFHDDGIIFLETKKTVNMTDQGALDYAIQHFSLQGIKDSLTEDQIQEAVSTARERKSKEGIGGFGITARSLAGIEEMIPGISELLHSQKGKIVFIGNGLSTAPIELLQNKAKDDTPQIVIADLFSYEDSLRDFQKLRDAFIQDGVIWPSGLNDGMNYCKALCEQINLGKIQAVRYAIGDGSLPDQLQDADIVVNSNGPPESTLNEQIQCLKVGGRLFTNYINLPETIGVRIEKIALGGKEVASIVTRNI